jgi:eukaryotic-like serine/threonine-protein kinase
VEFQVATAIQPGAVIDGKYRVVRRIGEGGMGTVYEGENVRIERRVAIKVLHEHVASSPEFAQRFEREARASARIGSAHVCDVLDLGDLPNGERFIVMEYLDGESLEGRLDRGLMSAQDLAPIAFEILEGLGSMHQVGVVHRDLKPANVFLSKKAGALRQTGRGQTEMVKILDFGVAKILPRADDPKEMTSTGMMMGTPLYMSPEQARGARDVDGRTDLYAASVIFYRALTGELPHSGLNLHELLFKIVLEEPRPIRDLAPSVDPMFAALVHKGLARDAENRYSSARAYQEAIVEWAKTQNSETLRNLEITLPEEDPPLRHISGGFPTARLQVAAAPGANPGRPEGPPTPQDVVTKAHGRQVTPVAPGGTPIVWSDDAPEIAKRAFAELEKQKAMGGGPPGVAHAPTLNSSTRMMPPMHGDTPAPQPHGMGVPASVPVVVPMKPNLGLRIALGAGGLAVVVVAIVAARYFAQGLHGPPPVPTTSVASAPLPPPDPHTLGTAPPPTPTDDLPPPPASVASHATSVSPPATVAAPTHRHPPSPGHPPPPPSSVTVTHTNPPPPPPPPSTVTPPTAPTPTSSGRKFRTNL